VLRPREHGNGRYRYCSRRPRPRGGRDGKRHCRGARGRSGHRLRRSVDRIRRRDGIGVGVERARDVEPEVPAKPFGSRAIEVVVVGE